MEFKFVRTNNYHRLLRQIVFEALPQIESMSMVLMNNKPSATKWSKKEILGHLIDSAYNNHRRFLKALEQEHLIFDGYDQENWVKLNNYQNRNSTEIVQLWGLINQQLSALIEQLPEEILWRKTTEHNFHQIGMLRPEKGTPSSLAYLVWDYIYHLEHHLSQIISDYEKLNSSFE